jgi:hypothetical protein
VKRNEVAIQDLGMRVRTAELRRDMGMRGKLALKDDREA